MSYVENLFDVNGKVAIVTGAARGNGKAISKALLNAGAKVVLADILEKELKASASEFSDFDVSKFVCDLNDSKQIQNLVNFTLEMHGRIDILVNNAGITISQDFLDYSEDNWDKTYSVNLKAPFLLSQKIAKIMSKQKSSSIINITSLNAELAFPDNPAYIAFKGALKQLTKSMAFDLGKYNIRVNSIGPGYFKTDMTKKSFSNLKTRNQKSDRTILGRWGDPEDLAGAILFLASEASSYVTGQDIYVDGGWLAKGL